MTSLFGDSAGGKSSSTGLLSNIGSALFGSAPTLKFAKGGIVNRETVFPLSNGKTGIMGEAGTEAILPLKRGPGGTLGVYMYGNTGQMQRQPTIIFNVQATDANSFVKSESQISAMLNRAVARGSRNL
jgi:lambda family phage tail tape measure protein